VGLQAHWFFGCDVVLELVFAVVALVLAVFAFRVFKITSERSTGFLGAGFLFISISYFFQSALNFLLVYKVGAMPFLTLNDFSYAITLQLIGTLGQMFFMLIGLVILLYMTFEVNRKSILAIMLLFVIIPLLFTNISFFVFYFISTICLIFVAGHFVKNYLRKKKRLNLVIAVAFVLLAVSGTQFVLSSQGGVLYVFGHLLELVAYLLLLVNFYLVLKK